MTGSLTLSCDPSTNLICVEGAGFWTEAQIREHFVRLRQLIADIRARGGRVRVIVDLRMAPPQSQAVAEIIRAETSALYRDEDRIAQLLASELQRMQMARITQSLHTEYFTDPVAALRWLDEGGDAR